MGNPDVRSSLVGVLFGSSVKVQMWRSKNADSRSHDSHPFSRS
jgi:hypothetical protein